MSDVLEPESPRDSLISQPNWSDADWNEAVRPPAMLRESTVTAKEQQVVAGLRRELEEMVHPAAAPLDAVPPTHKSDPLAEVPEDQKARRLVEVIKVGKRALKPLLVAGGAAIALVIMFIASAAKSMSGGGRGGH